MDGKIAVFCRECVGLFVIAKTEALFGGHRCYGCTHTSRTSRHCRGCGEFQAWGVELCSEQLCSCSCHIPEDDPDLHCAKCHRSQVIVEEFAFGNDCLLIEWSMLVFQRSYVLGQELIYDCRKFDLSESSHVCRKVLH